MLTKGLHRCARACSGRSGVDIIWLEGSWLKYTGYKRQRVHFESLVLVTRRAFDELQLDRMNVRQLAPSAIHEASKATMGYQNHTNQHPHAKSPPL